MQLEALWNAPVGLALFDTELRFVRVNAALAAINGVPVEAHLGRTVPEVLQEPSGAIVGLLRQVRDTGRAVDAEVSGVTPREPGVLRHWRVSYFPVPGTRRLVGVGCSVVEITAQKRIEEALRESEARTRARVQELEAVLDAVPAAVFITRDRSARHIEGNRLAHQLIGLPQGANLSLSAPPGEVPTAFRLLRDGTDLAPEEMPVQLASSTGTEVDGYAFDLVDADGRLHHMLGKARPFLCDDGSPCGAVGAFVDVTEARRAERAAREGEARLRWMADAMPAIVWVARPDGGLEHVNARFSDVTGLPPEAALGASWAGVVHPDDLPQALGAWAASLATGSPLEVEYRMRVSGGEYRWQLVRAVPAEEDGRVVRWFGTTTDVHDLKQLQERLRGAEQRLAEKDRRKDEFLAVLSHELRNPLAPIRTSVHILARGDPASAAARRAREVIERQVGHLTRLVDDLLDVTRITRGKIALRKVRLDLGELVRRTAEDHRPLVEGRGVLETVEVPAEPVWVAGDWTRLAQVVSNLVQNAAKFTPGGGEVAIRLCRAGDRAELRVADTGVGIERELCTRLFDPFVQADRTLARSEGGLGLGLALVKGLVDLHGGTVEARSDGPGRGSTFVIRLPAEPPGAEQVLLPPWQEGSRA